MLGGWLKNNNGIDFSIGEKVKVKGKEDFYIIENFYKVDDVIVRQCGTDTELRIKINVCVKVS